MLLLMPSYHFPIDVINNLILSYLIEIKPVVVVRFAVRMSAIVRPITMRPSRQLNKAKH